MFNPDNPYNMNRLPAYGIRNGSYSCHGDENPPIPYQGRIFVQTSNAIIAFAPNAGNPVNLPLLKTIEVQNAGIAISETGLQSLLEAEVERMLAAGHLQPGYYSSGLIDKNFTQRCGANLVDYFSDPADTIITLLQALPYLSPELQTRTRIYIQSEFNKYPPYKYTHIGWKEGEPREVFSLPPEVAADRLESGPKTQFYNFEGWKFSPMSFYAMWKYAQIFGNSRTIFDAGKARLEPLPPDSYLLEMPHVHNAYIAGYWGYLELEKMAGYQESISVRTELNRLLQLRKNNFSKDIPDSYFQEKDKFYCRALSGSRNFMYLVPELADYLRQNALPQVEMAVGEYERELPYWFVSKVEAAFGESAINHPYDSIALFQAKALILNQSRSELVKYLDIPAFSVGDLYFIQKLVYAIAGGN
jgi:hypothetical protein